MTLYKARRYRSDHCVWRPSSVCGGGGMVTPVGVRSYWICGMAMHFTERCECICGIRNHDEIERSVRRARSTGGGQGIGTRLNAVGYSDPCSSGKKIAVTDDHDSVRIWAGVCVYHIEVETLPRFVSRDGGQASAGPSTGRCAPARIEPQSGTGDWWAWQGSTRSKPYTSGWRGGSAVHRPRR